MTGETWKHQLAEFVSWVRHATRVGGGHRSDATINQILAAIGTSYEYQDRLGVETAISRSRSFGAKSPYKPFLHHISRTQSLRHTVVRVKAIKRLPRVLSPSEVKSLLDSCTRLRDRFLLCLLHERADADRASSGPSSCRHPVLRWRDQYRATRKQ